jgi:light-regulated signal transduction histidine kinase (bacteriophytochrome)
MLADLKDKNKELESFDFSVSHDLKAPMITIQGFLKRLEQDIEAGDSEYVHDDIHRVSAATKKMQQMLENVLALSRIGPGCVKTLIIYGMIIS